MNNKEINYNKYFLSNKEIKKREKQRIINDINSKKIYQKNQFIKGMNKIKKG
jgi:hypothetical protein